MSKVICVMGESGSGKTTAMRNLPPEETVYIDCDKKGLSWKGWRNEYNADNKNYMVSDDADKIMRMLVKISDKRPEIKYVVIDTINGIMVGDEMRRCKEKATTSGWILHSVYGIWWTPLLRCAMISISYLQHIRRQSAMTAVICLLASKRAEKRLTKSVLKANSQPS